MKASYNKYMRLQVGNQQAVTAQFYKSGLVVREMNGYFWKCNHSLTHDIQIAKILLFPPLLFLFKHTALTCWVRVQRPKSRGFSVSLPSSLFRYDMETESPSTQASRKLENLQNFTNSFPVKHLQRSKAPRCVHGFVRGETDETDETDVQRTYSLGRKSAVLPKRRMTAPRGLRIFLTSLLLSRENRLTRLKPAKGKAFVSSHTK